MSKQYNFLDCNYFNKDDKNHDIFTQYKQCDLEDAPKNTEFGILDPNISTIEIKDVEKGS